MTETQNSHPEQTTIAPWQRASLDDLAKVDFEGPIAGLNTADSEVLSDHYRAAAQKDGTNGGTDTADARVFSMLWSLTGMHFKPKEPNEPFGPMMTLADGSRSAIPTDFRGDHLEVVAYMAQRAINPVLRARLCDTCWLIDRKRAALATLAISSYTEIVRLVDKNALMLRFHEQGEEQAISREVSDLLRRALYISRAIGWDKKEAIEVRNVAVELRKRASRLHQPVSVLWFSAIDLDFRISDPSEVAVNIEGTLKNKMADLNVNVAIDLWRSAARAYQSAKMEDDKNRCQSEAAECLVAEAERHTGSALLASHWLSAAIRELHGVPGRRDRRTGLRHRLIDIQARVPEEMKEFSTELDVKEIAERVRNAVNNATFLDKLFVFADLARSPDPTDLRNSAAKLVAQHPLSFLFGGVHLDSDGKVIHRRDGGFEDNEGAIEQQIAQSEGIRRHIAAFGSIETARVAINMQHLISEDVLASLLRHSPFIPGDLLITFCRGFARFFQGDFIAAIYILTPLLENSLRYVLRAHGHDVTIFNDAAGTQEDKAISVLFQQMRAEMEIIFSKALIADIEHVFLKKPGPSIRHGVAHGLLQDGSAFNSDAIYGCWLIFRLCCLPLFAHRSDIEIVAG